MKFCLTKENENKLMKEVREGRLNPDKLIAMTSEEARKYLSSIVGDEAGKEINLLFEKKLLLKNADKAMYDFFRDVTGLSVEEKATARTEALKRIEARNGRIFNPKEGEKVLNEVVEDIYKRKYKIEPTPEELKNIMELSTDVAKNHEKMLADFTWKTEEDGLKYGASLQALNNYVESIKAKATPATLMNPLTTSVKESLPNNASVSAEFILGNTRILMTTFDNSFWGNQGIQVALDPKYTTIWAKDFAKSFVDVGQVLLKGTKHGGSIVDATKAQIFSQKNYLNGRFKNKGGVSLDIGLKEENYPTTNYLGRIPGIGRFFGASDTAYEAGALRLRTDLANKIYADAEKMGMDLTNTDVLTSLNIITNSMTGRGNLGKAELIGKELNLLAFAAKFAKSNVDFITAHVFDPRVNWKTKRTRFYNLLRVISSMVVLSQIGKALWPDDNKDNLNPISTNFLSVNIGKTRLIKPAFAQYITLLARILTQRSMSSSGTVTKLGEKYGDPTGMDVFWNFTEGKFSPLLGVVRDLVRQKDFNGNKPTVTSIISNLGTPMSLKTTLGMRDNMGLLLTVVANALNYTGFGTQDLRRDTNADMNIVLKDTKTNKKDFIDQVLTYSEAMKVDPETAFNRIFTGQTIMEVNGGQIIVVDRQPVGSSEAFKKEWVKKNGGSVTSMKEVKLDHIIPNKLGGSETADNWAVVSTSVWSDNTKVENTLIQAVKDKKISLKDAQALMNKYKRPGTRNGYRTEDPNSYVREDILKKYK